MGKLGLAGRRARDAMRGRLPESVCLFESCHTVGGTVLQAFLWAVMQLGWSTTGVLVLMCGLQAWLADLSGAWRNAGNASAAIGAGTSLSAANSRK